MTDKQIIINGVDVSGCDFLAKEDIYNSYSGVTTAYKGQCGCSDDEMCKDHRNCGYKKLARQLQRKTAELDEYKKSKQSSYEALQARANELEMSNRKLKQECEELKAYAQAQENQRETYYKEYLKLSQECKELKEYIQANKPTGICETCTAHALIQNDKYRKALKEIEGLIKNFCKDCSDYENCNWDKEGCYYSLIPNLKDIINKAGGNGYEIL